MKQKLMGPVLLLLAVTAGAQPRQDGSRWSLIPTAGMTVATLVGGDAKSYSNAVGWTAGLKVGRWLSDRVELATGLALTRNHVSEDVGPILYGSFKVLNAGRLRLQYLDVPVGVSVNVRKGLSVTAGVQPSLLVFGRECFYYDIYTCAPEDYDKVYSSFEDPRKNPLTWFDRRIDNSYQGHVRHNSNKLNISGSIGLAYEYKNMVFDARYHIGLLDVLDINRTIDVRKIHDDKQLYLSLTVGYRVPL